MYRVAKRAIRHVLAYIRPMHLQVQTVEGKTDNVELSDGHSAEEELALFLRKGGRYADGWVPLGPEAVNQLFLRYDQIKAVRIVP